MTKVYEARWPPLNVITPFHPESIGTGLSSVGLRAATISSSAPGANYVVYIPFVLSETALAVKLSYLVGGTQNGNCDMGIYDEAKSLVISSGTTAQGSTNAIQELDITDTLLRPGRYFMALTLSGATSTWTRATSNDEELLPNMGIYDETPVSFGLPSTAAWVLAASTSPHIPLMGVHFDTLV